MIQQNNQLSLHIAQNQKMNGKVSFRKPDNNTSKLTIADFLKEPKINENLVVPSRIHANSIDSDQ